jgi:hypothetical protein
VKRGLVVGAVVLVWIAVEFGDASAATTSKGPPPGATDRTVTNDNLGATICTSGSAAPHVDLATRSKVFARYKIRSSRRNRYVVDLLVPASLGGTISLRNVWPQLRANATSKNGAEELLHSLVCSGQIDLATAQQTIARDWTTAAASAQQVADSRKAQVGAFLAAQTEAQQQAALAEYLASLPPPTTVPPVTEPTSPMDQSSSTASPGYHYDCPAQWRNRECFIAGQQMCQGTGTTLVCTLVREEPGGRRWYAWL